MKKTTGATRKAPTHFEQVPIDLVKKQHALMRRAIEDTVAAKENANV